MYASALIADRPIFDTTFYPFGSAIKRSFYDFTILAHILDTRPVFRSHVDWFWALAR